ncbi:hypothetical protein NESM_000906200 [Novymonas esmeraldas]|uniref:Uncharacterized protein n=1 Tax=Novymonas esmeraldas TaxID=1808958 RepID=A0AAW0EZL5_9TRYP
MASDRTRTNDALVTHHPRGAVPPVERRTRVDPRTHARSVYERGPDGSQMYASYYNSNDDPTFHTRFHQHGNGGAFVQSAQFTFVSHGGGGAGDADYAVHHRSGGMAAPPPPPPPPPPVVEEEDDRSRDSDHGGHAPHTQQQRRPSHAEPIVEEPDDDDEDDVRERRAPRHERRRDTHRSPRAHARAAHPTGAAPFMADPWGMDAMFATMMQQQSAFPLLAAPRAQPLPPYAGDMFGAGGFENPFRMMEAMQRHMQQQRTAMFGGVDPFAGFR